jgi:excisionase family DNA binding protein
MCWDELDMPHGGEAAADSSSPHGEILMKSVSEERWLSLEEIAAYLGIKRDTVYKWIERKKMPAHKVGSLWKFRKDEIDEWVRSGQAADSTEPRKPK